MVLVCNTFPNYINALILHNLDLQYLVYFSQFTTYTWLLRFEISLLKYLHQILSISQVYKSLRFIKFLINCYIARQTCPHNGAIRRGYVVKTIFNSFRSKPIPKAALRVELTTTLLSFWPYIF